MINLADHDTFTHGVPYEAFKQMRDKNPVHWTPAFNGDKGFWSLTRHADVVAAQRNPDTFSSAQGIRIEDQSREEYLARRTFQETDGEEHMAVRRMVNAAFSRRRIMTYENTVRELGQDIVARAVAQGTGDGVEMIAKQLPMMMLGRILGVPDGDLDWLVERGDALIGNTDPDFSEAVIDKVNTDAYRLMPFRSPAGVEIYDYAADILAGRKPVSDEGILRLIMDADTPLDELAFKNFFALLVAAGNDTTRYSIAMALNLLGRDPALFEQLKSGDHWDTAGDEFIRLASPTLHFRRTATRDIDMHGQTIRKGDKVLMWFASANRDERVFDDPNSVQLGRKSNRNMAFGQGGPHVCLGMWLAKLELRVVLQELAAQAKSLTALSDPTWTRSNFICGVKTLQLRITPND